jgi:protocatechuate 3,4-dioxygenase beta subunit
MNLVRMMAAGMVLLAATGAPAQPAVCSATPAMAVEHYPGAAAIPRSNDLTRTAGKVAEREGEALLLDGRVLDAQCMPVANAVVELWQANPYGNWRVPSAADRASSTAMFSGAGRAITDSEGRFAFTTLFPGSAKGRAPRLYVRIAAPNQRELKTALFFADDERNAQDRGYKALKPATRETLTLNMQPHAQGYLARTTFVLPGNGRYRRY